MRGRGNLFRTLPLNERNGIECIESRRVKNELKSNFRL